MRWTSKCLFALVAAWGGYAHAEEPKTPDPAKAPTTDPAPAPPTDPAAPSTTDAPPAPPTDPAAAPTTDPAPAPASDAATGQGLSDADLAKLAEGEAIEIYDERPDKPFDRDTEVRLTGEELAARGAVDLATALALLPEVTVRDVGRGGFNVDIRGARKGAVSVLVDGVLVTDPYYGTFDVSTIPVTDIVQIRMSTSPQSPIDGPGGPGGVIEVLTRDAIGGQLVIARATSDSLPSFGVSGTARVALARRLALRMSASGLMGARDFDVPSGTVPEGRRAANGAARLEYRNANDRVALDAFIDDRHYVSPPGETSSILLIDRETTGRGLLKADVKRGKLQLQTQLFAQAMKRRSRNFMDAAMTVEQRTELMSVQRFGGMVLATSPIGKDLRWVASTSLGRDSGEDTVMGRTVSGETSIVESAADLQYEKKTVRLDGAAGVAAPIGVGADPWPEAKLVARWRPRFGPIEITATGARKGRVPSLRERFDSQMGGNAGLGPEKMTHAELRVIAEEKDQYRIDVAPFFRRTTGQVRFSTAVGHLVNLDTLDTYGVDVSARVHPHSLVEIGGAYNYIKLDNCGMATCTLDRLPQHRGEGWVEVTPESRFRFNARAKYFGKFVDQGMNLPAYTTLEASGTATLSRQYMIVLRGDDLLNARPETHAGYFGPGLVVSIVLQGQWE